MSGDRRDREIKYYQDRINQLEYENQLLRGCTTYRPPHQDLQSNSFIGTTRIIIEVATRNERLERETELYQREIKR